MRGIMNQEEISYIIERIFIKGIALVVFVASFCALVLNIVRHNSYLFNNAVNINDINLDDIDNLPEYVTVPVDGVFGCFAYTTGRGDMRFDYAPKIRSAYEKHHYMIWLEDDKILTLTISKGEREEELEQKENETWDYLNSLTGADIKAFPKASDFIGRVKEMEWRMKRTFNTAAEEMGITTDRFKIYYLEVDCADESKGSIIWTLCFLMAVYIAAGCVLFCPKAPLKRQVYVREHSMSEYTYDFHGEKYNSAEQNNEEFEDEEIYEE